MPDENLRKPLIQGEDLKEVYILMKLQQRAKQFDGDFKVEDSKLVCVYCNEKFDYKLKQLLHRHVWSKSHLQNKKALKAKLVTVKANYESDHNAQANFGDANETRKVRKKRLTPQEKIQRYVKEFGNVLKQKNDCLFCTSCNFELKTTRTSVERHIATKGHERNVSLINFKENGGVPPIFRKRPATATAAQQEFNIELCKVFLVSGVAISKLSHPIVQRFFKKYTTMSIPDHTTLRKSYLDIARTTLQTEARKLQQERFINKDKTPQTKGQKSKKRKGNEETEDPLVFTNEQLNSMLLLKKEPKEEPVDELEHEVKEKKSKKRKSNKINSKKKEDPLVFTDEQLESILLLKEEPMDQTESTGEPFEDPLSLPATEPKEEPAEPKEEHLDLNLEPNEEPWD